MKTNRIFFKRSTQGTEELLKYHKENGVKKPKKLLQDVSTRWNSTYYMLRWFVDLSEAVKSSLATMDDLGRLSQEEWERCTDLYKVLTRLKR